MSCEQSPHKRIPSARLRLAFKTGSLSHHGSKNSAGGSCWQPDRAGAHRAWRSGIVLCALGPRTRAWRELFGVPSPHFGKLRLGPRRSRVGLFAECPVWRLGLAPDRPSVRLFGTAQRLFARSLAVWRRVPVRLERNPALADQVERRPLHWLG